MTNSNKLDLKRLVKSFSDMMYVMLGTLKYEYKNHLQNFH